MTRYKVCRFHPELGEQRTFEVMLKGTDRREEILMCLGCAKESKPYGKAEFAS